MPLSAISESKNADDEIAAEIAAFRKSLSSVSTIVSATPDFETLDAAEDEDFIKWEDVYKGDITTHHLEEIKHELGLIELCWDRFIPDRNSSNDIPASYATNTQKEKLLLWLANNFRQQYHYHFPKRRPLLLACKNECRIQKMVSTTIRPTSLRHTKLQNLEGCASFIADYVQYVPLINVTALPDQLVSPGEVLARQTGHCYELATLLASLLIGASYNAYVVSGYATREICINDTTRNECTYPSHEQQDFEEQEPKILSKYELESPRDLRSQFLLQQQEKEKSREAAAKEAQAKAETKALMEFESPPPDPLWTHRRHAWVLVLPSKDATEPCFLEPASGMMKKVDDTQYHGIDSIWNHENYWVAVGQKRIVPCKGLTWDLNNVECWQHLLGKQYNSTSTNSRSSNAHESVSENREKYFDMPTSWVSQISLSNSDYERRYVDCQKIVKYRKCTVQLLSPYSDMAGMVTRVTEYTDYECTNVKAIREEYKNRADLMYHFHAQGDMEHHRFKRGRPDALKEHRFNKQMRGLPIELDMEFYHTSRQDSLFKVTKEADRMCEEFKNRYDFLLNRVTLFDDCKNESYQDTPILKITELFGRNPSKIFSDDIARIEFDYKERKARIVYHYGKEQISSHRRELCLSTMKQIACYDPDPQAKPLRPLSLHSLIQTCFEKMDQAEKSTRSREKEVQEILLKRSKEIAQPELLISLFDDGRNQDARDRYKEKDRKLQEKRARDLSLDVDLLLPYLTNVSSDSHLTLSAEEARNIYVQCLQDWKTLLLVRAVDIQRQFEQLCEDITRDSQENNKEGRDHRYFTLQCLQVRLMRHKELAPQRYLAIDACLRADQRLYNAFHTTSLWPKLSASLSN